MKDSTKRSVRTVLQAAVGLASALPMLVAAPGVLEALPWLGQAAAVAGALARVMAAPSVQRWLPSWLRVEPSPDEQLAALARRTSTLDSRAGTFKPDDQP
jgi:hypothetical protein